MTGPARRTRRYGGDDPDGAGSIWWAGAVLGWLEPILSEVPSGGANLDQRRAHSAAPRRFRRLR